MIPSRPLLVPTDPPIIHPRPPPRPGSPYADAPRLPETARVEIATLVRGTTYEVEIGPGRGGFIQERALIRGELGIVGLEVRRKWASIVDARLAKQGLADRARVLAEDAKDALVRLSPDACLSVVYLHFPDPWWKKRHEKRLVLDPLLLDQIARLLVDGGELFVQTDVSERASQYEALLGGDSRFTPAGDAPGNPRLVENPYEARSPRERRAILDGLPIHRIRFKRASPAREPTEV
jgi:tRNA (guanine-N7-)-methyltransferase